MPGREGLQGLQPRATGGLRPVRPLPGPAHRADRRTDRGGRSGHDRRRGQCRRHHRARRGRCPGRSAPDAAQARAQADDEERAAANARLQAEDEARRQAPLIEEGTVAGTGDRLAQAVGRTAQARRGRVQPGDLSRAGLPRTAIGVAGRADADPAAATAGPAWAGCLVGRHQP